MTPTNSIASTEMNSQSTLTLYISDDIEPKEKCRKYSEIFSTAFVQLLMTGIYFVIYKAIETFLPEVVPESQIIVLALLLLLYVAYLAGVAFLYPKVMGNEQRIFSNEALAALFQIHLLFNAVYFLILWGTESNIVLGTFSFTALTLYVGFSVSLSNIFSVRTKGDFVIKYLKNYLLPEVQNRSVPYYKYNFAVAIANLENLIPACKVARQQLFDATYEPWSDYDTNFEEVWIYRKTDSGISLHFLRGFIGFFSQFDDALNVIDDIVDEYWDPDELPDPVVELKNLFDEYKRTFDTFSDTISSLFDDLEPMAQYNVTDEACRKIVDDYSMEAYDENFDYYAEKAMSDAAEEYEELIKSSEQTVHDALVSLDEMISFLEKLKTSLCQLLEVNSKIDNTGL